MLIAKQVLAKCRHLNGATLSLDNQSITDS